MVKCMIVTTERNDGRKYKVQVPENATPETWKYGITIGPPDLSGLGLPPAVTTRLHNELFNRGLITKNDVRKKANEVQGALQAALNVDVSLITQLYT